MTGRTDKPAQDVTAIRGGAVTLAEAADAFLSSPRTASANTRRAHAGVIDRLAAELGPHRPLAGVSGDEIAAALRHRWGHRALATWNRNRAAVLSWLTWCASRKRWPAPQLSGDAERRKEHSDTTRALPRASIERLLSGGRALPGRRPRRTTGQGRPRLRDSLAGGSIRSRRPARESGRNTEWAQIPDSGPPFRAFPWLRSVTTARRATGKLTALWAGASGGHGRPAEGHRRRRRRVRARWPMRSSRA
jgi:hypothetical protein